MNQHLDDLVQRYPQLTRCTDAISDAHDALRRCFAGGGKLLLCGNGGSAADADHIAAELLKSLVLPRTLTPELGERLGPDLASRLQGGLPAIPLTGFNAFTSAFLNDCNGEYAFAQLTLALGKPGDALLCISTSGNSKNVLHAAEAARATSQVTIALTGEAGGALRDLVDICVCVPESDVMRVQELHLPVYHTLCVMLEESFFGETEEAGRIREIEGADGGEAGAGRTRRPEAGESGRARDRQGRTTGRDSHPEV